MSATFQRLSVLINAQTATALRGYAEQRGVSITETIRRAVGLLRYVTDEIDHGGILLVKKTSGDYVEITPVESKEGILRWAR